MNYKCIAYGGGGIFSILMDLVLPHIYELTDIENLYIEIQENEYGCPQNGFDFVFNQKLPEKYKTIDCGFTGGFGEVEHHKDLDKIKAACKKFKIKREILKSLHVSELGIHYRGVDMNEKHPDQGVFNFEDYKNKIDCVLTEIDPKSIFIASDNNRAAKQIIDLYDYKIPAYYFTMFTRAESLKESTFDIQVKHSAYKIFWQEAFKDMLSLSKSNYLICRTSNLSNAAIAFSDTLTKIYRL